MPEHYDSRSSKSVDIQDLNKRLFYNLLQLKWLPATSVFEYLASNYDIVLQIFASLLLHRLEFPKEPVVCTLITLKYIIHFATTTYGELKSQYRGDR